VEQSPRQCDELFAHKPDNPRPRLRFEVGIDTVLDIQMQPRLCTATATIAEMRNFDVTGHDGTPTCALGTPTEIGIFPIQKELFVEPAQRLPVCPTHHQRRTREGVAIGDPCSQRDGLARIAGLGSNAGNRRVRIQMGYKPLTPIRCH
jgi:hypothetical protein